MGLTLLEAKQLLARIQQAVVAAQAREHAALRPDCANCGERCLGLRQRPVGQPYGHPGSPARAVVVTRRDQLALAVPLDAGRLALVEPRPEVVELALAGDDADAQALGWPCQGTPGQDTTVAF